MIAGSAPILAQILVLIFIKEERRRVNSSVIVGLIVGVTGVVLLALPKLFTDYSETTKTTTVVSPATGYIMVGVAALCKAGASVFAQANTSSLPPLVTASGQTFYGTLFAILASLAVQFHLGGLHSRGWNNIKWNDWEGIVGLAYLGIMCSGIVYVCEFFLVNTIGSVRQTLAQMLVPLIGLLEGILIYGDWSNTTIPNKTAQVTGCLLVSVAIVAVSIAKGTNQQQQQQSATISNVNVIPNDDNDEDDDCADAEDDNEQEGLLG